MYCEEPGTFQLEVRTYWIHDTSEAEYARDSTEPLAIEDRSGGAGYIHDRQGSAGSTATTRALAASSPSHPQEPTAQGGVGLDSGSEASVFCPRRSMIGIEFPPPSVNFRPNTLQEASHTQSLRNPELGLDEFTPRMQESKRHAFNQERNERQIANGYSRQRANSADSAVQVGTQVEFTKAMLNENGVLGLEWKASKSWKEEQRRRPSDHELTLPDGNSQERGAAVVEERWTPPTQRGSNMRQVPVARQRVCMFYTGMRMLPVIKQELDKIESSFCGFQYQMDHTECIGQMVLKIARFRVQGRLLLDKENFFSSSCVRQAARVHELYRAGCEFKIAKPVVGYFACTHVKCLILDEKTVLTGSTNLTHNGLENNKEHLYCLTEPSFVAEILADFEKEWLAAQRVTDEEIREMLEKSDKRQEKKREKSMSRPPPGNVPRRNLNFSESESLNTGNIDRAHLAEAPRRDGRFATSPCPLGPLIAGCSQGRHRSASFAAAEAAAAMQPNPPPS